MHLPGYGRRSAGRGRLPTPRLFASADYSGGSGRQCTGIWALFLHVPGPECLVALCNWAIRPDCLTAGLFGDCCCTRSALTTDQDPCCDKTRDRGRRHACASS
jgi:hypothetical protein